MKKVLLLLIISVIEITIIAQSGYIVKDSTMVNGVRIKDNGSSVNQRICTGTNNGIEFRYNPFELKEYAIKESKVYVSKEISVGDSTLRVFLERKTNGKTKLYYYSGKGINTFFVERGDDKIYELAKVDKNGIRFKDNLNFLASDCPAVYEATRLVRYTENSLTFLINQSNNCEIKPFPHFRYGLIAGWNMMNLHPSSFAEYKNLQTNDKISLGMPFAGVFIDNPIAVTNYSIHAELYVGSGKYNFSKPVEDIDFHIVGHSTAISLPVMMRLTFLKSNLRPFINAGIIQSYLIRDDYSVYDTKIYNSYIEINRYDYHTNASKMKTGALIGMGLDYKLNMRNYLSLELRYNIFPEPKNSESFGESGIGIQTSFSF
jgi:outer membrane protein W